MNKKPESPAAVNISVSFNKIGLCKHSENYVF